jgi:thiol-disulfide isomerase/thioredoxin
MPPAVIDQPSRDVAKWPIVAVAAVSRSGTRTPPKTIVVAMVSTAPVADHVGRAVPSQSSGSPVGPTGGDNPQARAVSARAANTVVARLATAITVRLASMHDPSTRYGGGMRMLSRCSALVVCAACSSNGAATSAGTTFTDRLAAANRAGQPLVIEFGATWCEPCHDFAEHVLTDARVRAALRGVAFVQYDLETSSGAEAAKRCNVTGVPAVIEVTPDGSAHPFKMGSEPTIEELVTFLQQAKARTHP